MDRSTAGTALLVAAAVLVVLTQATLWWRYGRSHPHTAWPAVFAQASALTVLALVLWQSGDRVVGVALGCQAAAAGAGIAGSAAAAGAAARAQGTTWRAQHRAGLRAALVSVETAAAVVALLLVAGWVSGRFAAGFGPTADTNLCRLLDRSC